jgi:hypothetical protein
MSEYVPPAREFNPPGLREDALVAAPVPAMRPGDFPFYSPPSGVSQMIIVPPGGFAGFGQQTPATQQMFARAGRKGGQRSAAKRRRRKKTSARAAPKRKRARRAKPARLVKGSAAAKRYMAKIRRKRKR